MSTATANLLHEFERLSPDEQREFSAVIVHRAAQLDYGEVSDEELTASAARMFAMWTRRRMPRRGEVWLVDLGMAQKTRPAVILNVPFGESDRVVVTVISHTTSVRSSPFEVVVPVPFLREGAFVAQSITTIPTKHALRRLGVLTAEQFAPIEDAVRTWLGL